MKNTNRQIKFKQQNLNAGQLNKNNVKQNFTTMWMRYIYYMHALIACRLIASFT